ncbi:MAG: methyltransferase domain-containing protein [Pseudomonadales bacterium]
MNEDFIEQLKAYEDTARKLEGWRLEFEPEPLLPGPPWDYEDLARSLVSEAHSVLDLGTGGGEVFSGVISTSRCHAIATEEWYVNAPVAARRLQSRAPVVRASSLALPFSEGAFDVVLSRHEEISPTEVVRVLAEGGEFLTQQVIPDIWHELRDVFADMTRFPDHYVEYQREFTEAGAVVRDAREFRRPVRFRELGHLVYHLVAAPWTIPGFSVESHHELLGELAQRVRINQGLVLTEGFYLLRVRA